LSARATSEIGAMNKLSNSIGHIAVAGYAAVSYLSSLVLIVFAAVLRHTHAAGAAGVPLVAGGLFGLLAPFIWRGSRWAPIGTFAISLVAALIMISEAPTDWWLAVPFPSVFGLLTLVVMITYSSSNDAVRSSNVIANAHAGLIYLYSFVAVFLWPDSVTTVRMGVDPWGYTNPRYVPFAALFGFVLGALSIPIWRGRLWAMLLACGLTLAHWLALATLVPAFWTDPWYAAAPAVSAILTVLFIGRSVRAKAA
jgi:hypothetical protein